MYPIEEIRARLGALPLRARAEFAVQCTGRALDVVRQGTDEPVEDYPELLDALALMRGFVQTGAAPPDAEVRTAHAAVAAILPTENGEPVPYDDALAAGLLPAEAVLQAIDAVSGALDVLLDPDRSVRWASMAGAAGVNAVTRTFERGYPLTDAETEWQRALLAALEASGAPLADAVLASLPSPDWGDRA